MKTTGSVELSVCMPPSISRVATHARSFDTSTLEAAYIERRGRVKRPHKNKVRKTKKKLLHPGRGSAIAIASGRESAA